jgi:Glycosyl transferases group 1
MKVSFYTVDSNIRKDNGYGYAGNSIRTSLENLGHAVGFHDEHADVELDFCQPTLYSHSSNQYKIGYTPWESSSLPEGWLDGFNSVDEVWTTSQKCKEWYENAGVKRPVRVYEHGVESIWQPKRRNPKKKIRFLHIGEPAPRKGGQLALEAFRAAFDNRDDVHLTIKANGHNTTRAYVQQGFHRGGPRNILGLPHQVYQNVTLVEDTLPEDELVGLYHAHDVLVYPSWGEGFGLIPLQALATGMPTICTGAWAPYQRFLGNLSLDSDEYPSRWPDIHPGMMYRPDYHHLVELYKYSYENYDALSTIHFDNAKDVHSEYNWNTLTKNAFKHLENKF